MSNNFINPLNLEQPLPLSLEIKSQDYPQESIPTIIKNAIDEVHGFVKAPYPMIASAAFGAISLVLQSKYDVERDSHLIGPCSIFFLTIADSGERKSTCDGFFSNVIRNYESEQIELLKPAIQEYEAKLMEWEDKVSGVRDKIRSLAKDKTSTDSPYYERSLQSLIKEKPNKPLVPRLIYSDVTPEALAFSLHKNWPSGAIFSSEAGIVFGSHAMNKDAIMRNLGMLNTLWDGNPLTIDRRTSESFRVEGARLSISLQVQEPTLREFFKNNGSLARGTGFLARFLLAWPESTQGTRAYSDSPKFWPRLSLFNENMKSILNTPCQINENGSLIPKVIPLSPNAKKSWIEYHDKIEGMLIVGGLLTDIRDVASKIADNAARLAAIFELFSNPNSEEISDSNFVMAAKISDWHLNESRRFLGELSLPPEIIKATQLESWLIKYCKQNNTEYIPKSYLLQYGPNHLRNKETMDNIIRELSSLKRVKILEIDKRQYVFINPTILGENLVNIGDSLLWPTEHN